MPNFQEIFLAELKGFIKNTKEYDTIFVKEDITINAYSFKGMHEGRINVKKYTSIILKAILSLALTIAYFVIKKDNWLLILPTWPVVYAVISLYFHVRKMFKDDEEVRYRKRYHDKNEDALFELFFDLAFHILVPNVIFPAIAIAAYFGGSWWLVERFLPERWHEPVEIIIAILGVIGIIIYDIMTAKEEAEGEKYRVEAERERIENLIKSKNEEENYVFNLEFDDSVYEDDPKQRETIEKYKEYCKIENIPDEVLTMMNIRGMTLSQCMQLKFAYESGLSIKQIASIAHPEISRGDMQIAIYNYARQNEEIAKYYK